MELNYKSFGQGEPLIIMHGLFGSLDNWQTLAKKFGEHFQVFTVDLRNHGRSPHAEEMNYALMARDIAGFMTAQGLPEAHILGHSMGGKVAMQFAIDFPSLTKKLMVVDISPSTYSGGHHEIFEALFALNLEEIESRKDADEQLQSGIPEFGVRQFLLKNLTRSKEGGYVWKMNLQVIYDHYLDILAPIQSPEAYEGPCLFVKGGKSGYITEAHEPKIKALFPNCRIETIAEAGHWVHAEQPQQLLDVVTSFLNT